MFMKQKTKGLRTLHVSKENKVLYYGLLFALLAVYFVAALGTTTAARSEEILMIGNYALPISAFTGVFSSIDNLCVIFLVLFYGKEGFIISLIILAAQFPGMVFGLLERHTLMSIPGFFTNGLTLIAIIVIYNSNKKIHKYQLLEMDRLKTQQKISRRLFEQTATALVNAIDAKDTYSHGHSIRVAEYSAKLAELMGKDEDECRDIYYAALLHDVGKIGIDDRIINKKGKLTGDEFKVIMTHPVMGHQILSKISEYPFLSIGAHFHHERYDGKGYPDKLKGDDIPELARIISVADAYDAMSSNRSYRDAIPQQLVREEIVKGIGTQFDPEIAQLMIRLIDADVDYDLRERDKTEELTGENALVSEKLWDEVTDGVLVTSNMAEIRFKYTPLEAGDKKSAPVLLVFDALDGRFHDEERTIRDLNYSEYCEIRLDGNVIEKDVRKSKVEIIDRKDNEYAFWDEDNSRIYNMKAVKYKDHLYMEADRGDKIIKITLALPDSTRYAYIGISGAACKLSDLSVVRSADAIDDKFIPRIADPISFIDGPEGDIPNVQIDGFRTEATEGIPITDGLQIKFHTMSLPTARLIWHCPFIDIFYSDDKKVNGSDYTEYSVVRIDGEKTDTDNCVWSELIVSRSEEFDGWDDWKIANKQGLDVVVNFARKDHTITVTTENEGVLVKCTTVIPSGKKDVYVALTGDQVALTDIKIIK